MNNVVNSALTHPAFGNQWFGGGGISSVFTAMGANGTAQQQESNTIASHTFNGKTWLSAEGLADQFGPGLSAPDDIVAPVAAIDLDNTRLYNGTENVNFITTSALVQRLRMGDRSWRFAHTNINLFLESAVGTKNIRYNHSFTGQWHVDFYVPKARLVVDISSPTLRAQKSKIEYLQTQRNIRHIEFVCSPPDSNTMSIIQKARNNNLTDVERLLYETIPTIFSYLFAQFSTGNIENSISVMNYVRGYNPSSSMPMSSSSSWNDPDELVYAERPM